MKTLTAILVLCVMTAAASAATPFDGNWTARVVRAAGTQDLTIALTTTDGKVTGTLGIVGGGQSPIEWGIVKGDLITFKVKMPFQNGQETFVYLGRIEGDSIAFGRRPENLTLGVLVEFTATRSPSR
jgi:hypothetical protein